MQGYLRYNYSYGLHYARYSTIIEGYSEVNLISYIKDLEFTNECVFTMESETI